MLRSSNRLFGEMQAMEWHGDTPKTAEKVCVCPRHSGAGVCVPCACARLPCRACLPAALCPALLTTMEQAGGVPDSPASDTTADRWAAIPLGGIKSLSISLLLILK